MGAGCTSNAFVKSTRSVPGSLGKLIALLLKRYGDVGIISPFIILKH